MFPLLINVTATPWPNIPAWWPDISIGLLFGVLGLAGAVVVVFLGLRDWESVVGTTARMLQLEGDIDEEKRQIDSAKELADKKTWMEIRARDLLELEKEKGRVRNWAIGLYWVAGSILAFAFARSVVEAVAIGGTWTSFVGLLGLKADQSARKESKSQVENQQLSYFTSALKEALNKQSEAYKSDSQDSYLQGIGDAVVKIAAKSNMTEKDLLEMVKA